MSRAAGTIAELAARLIRPCIPTTEHLPRSAYSRWFWKLHVRASVPRAAQVDENVARLGYDVKVHAKLSTNATLHILILTRRLVQRVASRLL
jgi:hypothetical protein